MDKDKLTKKLKEGVSMQEIEGFVKSHTISLFAVIAIFVGAISSVFDFFTGPSLTLLFLGLGVILAIAFPVAVEKIAKKVFLFTSKQEKTAQIVLGGLKVVIALFVPFIFFGFIGALAGCSYHYYIRHSQIMEENKGR